VNRAVQSIEARLASGAGALAALAAVALVALQGCASHSEQMLPVRVALDQGDPRGAIALLDQQMGVAAGSDLPADIQGDKALFVLDRGSIQQSIGEYAHSKADLEAADKAIDMLDLAHDAKDSIGEYVFSGSSGKYQAPPYEKLLVNTLDMINYLELRDLDGARVEARRLAVMQKYLSDDLHEGDNAVIGLGGMLAGLTFEQSGQTDEALRWYDEALQFTGFHSLSAPVRRLLAKGSYRSPRLKALESSGPPPPDPAAAGEGEIVFVIGYGRVPHKIPKRVPIGLALTWSAGAISPDNAAKANALAAQGLVTWINYPTLGPERGGYEIPACVLDGNFVQLEEAVDVTTQVRGEWKKIEGKIIVSAITRMITRLAAGAVIKAAGKGGLVGELLSLGTQATLTVLDTPDTRSWETLPARIAIARVRVPAGRHNVHLDARGVLRDATVDVEKGGWSVVSLMALR
jgi:hypothetical protein